MKDDAALVLECPRCETRYELPVALPENGRKVRCANCAHVWVAKAGDEIRPDALPAFEDADAFDDSDDDEIVFREEGDEEPVSEDAETPEPEPEKPETPETEPATASEPEFEPEPEAGPEHGARS